MNVQSRLLVHTGTKPIKNLNYKWDLIKFYGEKNVANGPVGTYFFFPKLHLSLSISLKCEPIASSTDKRGLRKITKFSSSNWKSI